jgi:hypothetical protein
MEQWEIDLREKLEKELPDGAYYIGSSKMCAYTGKQGYIHYRVELVRLSKNPPEIDLRGLEAQINSKPVKEWKADLTMDDIDNFIKELNKNIDNGK